MKKYEFLKRIEKQVNPKDTATLQALSPFFKLIPKTIQSKIMKTSAKKKPFMGFIVDPYSVFICYEIKDLSWAKSLLPDDFDLIKTSIFTNDLAKYYMIFGTFNVRSSAFSGTRLEVNIIARNKKSKLLSWVIIDYDTNTLSHDKMRGVVDSTTSKALLTTDFNGNIIADIVNEKESRELIFDCNTKQATWVPLNQKLWFEGNLSVGYGRKLSNNSGETFSLKFDPKEIEKACNVNVDDIVIDKNTWFEGLIYNQPEKVVYFPYAQHYLSDSPGHSSQTSSELEMIDLMNKLDLDKLPEYSAEPLRKLVIVVMSFNSLMIILLILWIFFK